MTAPGRHWLADVVQDGEGAFSGTLPVESLLEQTAPLLPVDQPTVEFDRAAFEYGLELDRKIAAARLAEAQRLAREEERAEAALSWWRRACRSLVNWLVTR